MVLAGRNEVLGRRLAVPAGHDLEGNLLPFVQCNKASHFDGADMDEYVSGAILRLDEPVTRGGLNHLTVPVAIIASFHDSWAKRRLMRDPLKNVRNVGEET